MRPLKWSPCFSHISSFPPNFSSCSCPVHQEEITACYSLFIILQWLPTALGIKSKFLFLAMRPFVICPCLCFHSPPEPLFTLLTKLWPLWHSGKPPSGLMCVVSFAWNALHGTGHLDFRSFTVFSCSPVKADPNVTVYLRILIFVYFVFIKIGSAMFVFCQWPCHLPNLAQSSLSVCTSLPHTTILGCRSSLYSKIHSTNSRTEYCSYHIVL